MKSVKRPRRLRVVKVNEPMAMNQVYVDPELYDSVFGHIGGHCPQARIEG